MTSVTAPAPESQRWSGPSPLRGVREALVSLLLLLCAVITVLTTAGIVLVLGIETIAFFRESHVGLGAFLFGTVLRPEGTPPRGDRRTRPRTSKATEPPRFIARRARYYQTGLRDAPRPRGFLWQCLIRTQAAGARGRAWSVDPSAGP